MFSRSSYYLTVKSYQSHGSEIIFTRKNGAGGLARLILLVFFIIYVYGYIVGSLHSNTALTAIMLLSGMLVFYSLNEIHTESLLVISSIGVTFKQASLFSSKSTFFDVSSIRDIVILEAISKQSVIFQLVLLPTTKKSCDKNQQIYPLFKSFQPRLEDLKTVYRHVQEKMIFPKNGSFSSR